MRFPSKLQQAGEREKTPHPIKHFKKFPFHTEDTASLDWGTFNGSPARNMKNASRESRSTLTESCAAHIARNVHLSKHPPTVCYWQHSEYTQHRNSEPFLFHLNFVIKLSRPRLKKKEKKSLPVWREPVNSLRRYWANFNISRLHRFLQPLILSNKVFLWGEPEVFANKKETASEGKLLSQFVSQAASQLLWN